MRTVKLFGELGKRFKSEIRLDVKSPAEAIRALCANFKGFEKYLREAESKQMRFKVIAGRAGAVALDDIHVMQSGEIRIVPVIVGAGGDAFSQVIIGGLLIAASFFIPGSTPFLAGLASATFGIGASVALGGLSQLISPTPTNKGPQERPENKPSYSFNGPVNTTMQGNCVPIAYGEVIVGSAVVSAGISIDTLKAGYRVVLTEATEDVDALGTEDGYLSDPPDNYFRRELLSKEFVGLLWTYHYRFYYYVETLVAI